jgi:hypothetical protein
MSKRDQYVIACVESAADAAMVLPWARHFAERLRHKGLMALHVKREQGDAPEWLKELGVPYASLTGDWHTAIEGLPTAFGAILAVAAVNPDAPRSSLNHPRTLWREFKDCKTGYLVVSRQFAVDNDAVSPAPLPTTHYPLPTDKHLPTATLTLTHHREGREKLVWASYLARFLDYRVVISHPDYRDKGLRQRWQNNMHFADKMFTPLNINYTHSPLNTQHSTLVKPDLATLDQLHPDILVARTTDPRDLDLVDLVVLFLTRHTSLAEYRLLTHPSHTPVLFLNPRDDLYILCD